MSLVPVWTVFFQHVFCVSEFVPLFVCLFCCAVREGFVVPLKETVTCLSDSCHVLVQ